MASLFLLLLLLLLLLPSSSSFVPRDNLLINCGASGQLSDNDNRTWTGDSGSKFAPSFSAASSFSSPPSSPSVPSVPFSTARVFTSSFTYSFPVAPGRKSLRLYFYPADFPSHPSSAALFSVTSPPSFTLLRNFSARGTAVALNFDYLVREFSVNVSSSGFLNLTFSPSSPYSFAFVNGIEIVSAPDDIFSLGNPTLIPQGTPYTVDDTVATQTMYHLNVGGNSISPIADSGLFREWHDDSPYIFGAGLGVTYGKDPNVTISYTAGDPAYVAPEAVYATARSMGPDINVNKNFNLTWILSVDAGFYYLVRLHFCEIQYPITQVNMRVFDIFLNDQTAFEQADVIQWTKSIGVPVFQDYVVFVQGNGQQDLWVALHPSGATKPFFFDAILNGLEVFKLSQPADGNLAGPNPVPPPEITEDRGMAPPDGGKKKANPARVGGMAAGGAALLLVCASAFIIFCWRARRLGGKEPGSSDGPSGWVPLSLYGNSHSAASGKTSTTGTGSYVSSLRSNLGRHFSFAEIESATNGFDESLLVGVGGFGKVYQGTIDGGAMKVAIKRANPMSEQGVHEFQTEIEMLSKLRHRHLVSLIGYCEENREMILVYDYMAHGTLREHLYKTQNPPLSWKQRLEICIGASRGLHYLHTGAKHTIIHRDVKTTNILLDEKWVAKVADFGLSKTGPTLDNTHVSTVVKGSFGYLDPEYFRRQQLTDKSDVYSFGVVLFEVLCARPALNPTLPKEQVSLAEWALHCQKKGVLDQIIDPFLKGKIAPQCFKKFAETAEKCVADQGIDRPSMGDVLWNLEFAQQLQETAEQTGVAMPGKEEDEERLLDSGSSGITTTTTTMTSMSIGGQSLASDDSEGLTPSAVFSQIVDPKGR